MSRAILAALMFASVVTAAEPRKVALVVGVNEYDHAFEALSFAEADATKLAAALREGGFEVVLLTGSAKGEARHQGQHRRPPQKTHGRQRQRR